MSFWDSSAIVPLLVNEPHTQEAQKRLRENPQLVVWWATPIECASAIARLVREHKLDASKGQDAEGRLETLGTVWTEVLPTPTVRNRALRLLRVHALRAADALQLAAALVWAHEPTDRGFITLDGRLGDAARKEGFRVVS